MSALVWILLLVASLVTATMSAFLGMAGGVTLLGIMTVVLPPQDVVPIHGVVQLGSNISRTLVFLRYVRWAVFFVYALPYAAGIGLATLVWSGSSLTWFEPAIGALVLLFLVYRRFSPKVGNLPKGLYVPLGFATGFLALFVGAIGPLTAAFFFRDDFEKEEVIATAAVCQAWGHFAKIPAFIALGYDFFAHGLLMASLIFVGIGGAFFGRSILERISPRVFTLIFELVLGAMAIYLILHGFCELTGCEF